VEPDTLLDLCRATPYKFLMIRSFRSKPLRIFFETDDGSKLPVQNPARVRRQLNALDAATAPEQMAFPGWRFHPLKGKPRRYAVDASGDYRMTFGFKEEDAIEVDLEDYH
jgi:proteic killer suppression protein